MKIFKTCGRGVTYTFAFGFPSSSVLNDCNVFVRLSDGQTSNRSSLCDCLIVVGRFTSSLNRPQDAMC